MAIQQTGQNATSSVDTSLRDNTMQSKQFQDLFKGLYDPGSTRMYSNLFGGKADDLRKLFGNAQMSAQQAGPHMTSSAADIASVGVQERGMQNNYISSMFGASNATKLTIWNSAMAALKTLANQGNDTTVEYDPGDPLQGQIGGMLGSVGAGVAGGHLGGAAV